MLLIGLLIFGPATFGVVHFWSAEVVIAVAAVMLLVLSLKSLLIPHEPFVWTVAYIPIALFVALVVLQLTPLPLPLLRLLSPSTVAIKSSALQGDFSRARIGHQLTFYAIATKRHLALLLAVSIVFCAALNLFRDRHCAMRILTCITLVGAAVGLLALAQVVFGSNRIYWFEPPVSANCAVFMCHSHFGQFMNLSIGAALALLMVRLAESRASAQRPSYRRNPAVDRPWGAIPSLLLIMIGVSTAAIFLALTRDGVIALVIAGSLLLLILLVQKSLLPFRTLISITALAALVGFVCFTSPAVRQRLSTLTDPAKQAQSRVQILRSLAHGWVKYPLFGTGLGTHEYVFPMFDDAARLSATATHAENEYAQLMTEVGLIGLVLAVVFVAIICRSLIRSIRRPNEPMDKAALGLMFGLVAVVIQSFGDFGQHLPANACLTAVFCALALSMASPSLLAAIPPSLRTLGRQLCWARFVGPLVIVLTASWFLVTADHDRIAEQFFSPDDRSVREFLASRDAVTNSQQDHFISLALAAYEQQPDDVKYLHWANVFRWQRLNQLIETHHASSPQWVETQAQQLVDAFDRGKILCPCYVPNFLMAGQIRGFLLGDALAARDLRTAFALAPMNAEAAFCAGVCDAHDGDFGNAMQKFRRVWPSPYSSNMVDLLLKGYSRPDLAVQLLSNDPFRLQEFINRSAESGGSATLQELAARRLIEIFSAQSRNGSLTAANCRDLAEAYVIIGNLDAAIECYGRAVRREPDRFEWHMRFSELLEKNGASDRAYKEARICLRMRPEDTRMQNWVAELDKRRAKAL